MHLEHKSHILTIAANTQLRTAPVIIQIGYTHENGQVNDESLVIIKAPPAVIKDIMDYCSNHGLYVSAGAGGLLID